MASFIELTERQQSKKILLNLEEITFIEVLEKKKGKTTIIHFTSSTYNADRSVAVLEEYDTVKSYISRANLMYTGK